MTKEYSPTKKNKKDRIKINTIADFKNHLENENHTISTLNEEELNKHIIKIFNIDDNILAKLYSCLEEENVTYKVDDTNDFVKYIKNIMEFEGEQEKLSLKIKEVKGLNIDRIEYERIITPSDDVASIIKIIEKTKNKVAGKISEEELERLNILEGELSSQFIFSKDIDLLKKMIINDGEILEEYNENTKVKRISIKIPKTLNPKFIKVVHGSVEYHTHLKSNILRIKRLNNNLNKYMKASPNEEGVFNINQSTTLLDTLNIALATYDNHNFKAISGGNTIHGYCDSPKDCDSAFKSLKVNKLGNLGVGYNRVNDSEKKILEKIHREIELKNLRDDGNLILYTKLEPCPSCYYVISQFCEKHPNVKVSVKFLLKYGM